MASMVPAGFERGFDPMFDISVSEAPVICKKTHKTVEPYS